MNETRRGVVIFVTALITIWLWAPLSSDAARTASGVIVTDTFFGPFRYLTLHTELKEPEYTMTRKLNSKALALTTGLSAALWCAVVWAIRRKPKLRQ